MTNYATQQQNDDMMSLIASQFRLLYNPVHAFADAISMLKMFPGIVGIWPNSITNGTGQLMDISGNGLHLTRNADPDFNISGLAPYARYAGTDYFNHTDNATLSIVGNEAWFDIPGLTLGGWFYVDALGNNEAFIGKRVNTMANAGSSYGLTKFDTGGGNALVMQVANGTTAYTASYSSVAAGGWFFGAGRYTPSSQLKVWYNDQVGTNTTSIPATINDNATDFIIGAVSGPARQLTGRTSLCFLSAAAVPDIFINTFYQMTAPLFNVSI